MHEIMHNEDTHAVGHWNSQSILLINSWKL